MSKQDTCGGYYGCYHLPVIFSCKATLFWSRLPVRCHLVLLSFTSDINFEISKKGISCCITYYYIDESVLLGTKPLVDSIRHFIRDPGGVFSVCHLCECRIVQ